MEGNKREATNVHWREGRESRRAVQALGILAVVLTAAIGTARGAEKRAVAADALIVRHPWPHAHAALQLLAKEYSRESGIAVRVLLERDGPRAVAPRSDADIIGLPSFWATEARVAAAVKAGALQDIRHWLPRHWHAQIAPVALRPFVLAASNRWGVPPGTYGVPLSAYVQLLIYQPELLARAGVRDDPAEWQWNDLLAAGERLSGAGIEPLVGAFHQRSHPALSHAYEVSYLGATGLLDTYEGRARYTAPPWRALFRIYPALREAGICRTPLALAPRAEAQRAFLARKAAMLLDGPWFAGVAATRDTDPNFWRACCPPWGAQGARFMPGAPGGVCDSLVVSPRSTQRARSARFLCWLTRLEQQIAYANATWHLPASLAAASSSGLHPLLQRFAEHLDDASPDLSEYEHPEVNRVHYEGVIGILRGETTPDAVLAALERGKAGRRSQPGGKMAAATR